MLSKATLDRYKRLLVADINDFPVKDEKTKITHFDHFGLFCLCWLKWQLQYFRKPMSEVLKLANDDRNLMNEYQRQIWDIQI